MILGIDSSFACLIWSIEIQYWTRFRSKFRGHCSASKSYGGIVRHWKPCNPDRQSRYLPGDRRWNWNRAGSHLLCIVAHISVRQVCPSRRTRLIFHFLWSVYTTRPNDSSQVHSNYVVTATMALSHSATGYDNWEKRKQHLLKKNGHTCLVKSGCEHRVWVLFFCLWI